MEPQNTLQNLSQEQKNYILMLLMGGDLPQNEIRMFLARSGWSIDLIDAGVEYADDPDLKRTLREARGESIDSTTMATPTKLEQISIENVVVTEKDIDPYRETAEIASNDFSTSELLKSVPAALSVPSISNSIGQLGQISSAGLNLVSSDTKAYIPNAVTMTMPDTPKVSTSSKILSAIIWLLCVTALLLTVSVAGFMYYTKTGLFGDVIYNKININV